MTSVSTPIFGWSQRLSLLATLALLCAAGAESTKFRPPPDASAYRQRVGLAEAAVPMNLGEWVGTDVPVEQSAVKLLRPYFIISRRYVNQRAGMSVDLLFVDCQDARDTVGHYPPICYPSQGWSLQGRDQTDWNLSHMTIHGMEYTFVKGVLDASDTELVDDFFVLPGQGTQYDRTAVMSAAGDLQRRFYGVAQVQLVFSGEYTKDQRRQAFNELIGPLEGLIQTVETIHDTPASAKETR
jgi:hypothetical protein